jgi:hypothetical protein
MTGVPPGKETAFIALVNASLLSYFFWSYSDKSNHSKVTLAVTYARTVTLTLHKKRV